MSESSLGKSLVKGVAVLVGSLLLFVTEQYIQHHYWSDKPPGIIPIAGRVVDALGTKAIENAMVQLNIGEIHENQSTDSEGRYAFSLKGFDPQTAASMVVDAPGYKHLSMNLLLNAMAEDKEMKLEALTQPGPGHPGIGAIVGATWIGPAGGTAVTNPAVTNPAMVNYVRRVDPKVILARN